MTTILTGAIHTIFPTENYGNFTKRVLWLKETDVKYPSIFSIEFWHDDISCLEDFKGSEIVNVQVEIRGKLWSKGGKENVINILKGVGVKKI